MPYWTSLVCLKRVSKFSFQYPLFEIWKKEYIYSSKKKIPRLCQDTGCFSAQYPWRGYLFSARDQASLFTQTRSPMPWTQINDKLKQSCVVYIAMIYRGMYPLPFWKWITIATYYQFAINRCNSYGFPHCAVIIYFSWVYTVTGVLPYDCYNSYIYRER